MRPIILFLALALLAGVSACSGGDKDSFRNVDHDKSGKISYEELLFVFPEATSDTFRNADKDGDGLLSESEYALFLKNSVAAPAVAEKSPPAPLPAAPKAPPAPVTKPGETNQPAVPFRGEEVIEIPAPGTDARTKAKMEKGKKEQKAKPEAATPSGAPGGEATQYTVLRGDNLTKIAHKFGITVEDIVRANNNMSPDTLRDGQVLNIPARP